jgi:hypothetical protein
MALAPMITSLPASCAREKRPRSIAAKLWRGMVSGRMA